MTSRKRFLTGGIAACAAGMLTPRAAAQADGGEAGPEIEGAWLVTIPTVPGPTISLQTYFRGGAVLENNNVRGIIQPGTTGHGAWEKVAPHKYTKTVQWFSSQPAPGSPTLRVMLRELIEVSGEQFVILAAKRIRYLLDGSVEREFPCESAGGIGVRVRPELPACP